MDSDRNEWNGACHCGTVRLRVRLSDGLRSARRCNCSYCRMRGAIAVTALLGDVDVVAGADALTIYQFNTKSAKHHFCSKCGIYTHHQRRSNPNEYGVNVGQPVRLRRDSGHGRSQSSLGRPVRRHRRNVALHCGQLDGMVKQKARRSGPFLRVADRTIIVLRRLRSCPSAPRAWRRPRLRRVRRPPTSPPAARAAGAL